MHKSAITIQKWARGWIARWEFARMKEEAEVNDKEILMKKLWELNMVVKRCGYENRLTLDQAANKIQAFVRARKLRKILQPYF